MRQKCFHWLEGWLISTFMQTSAVARWGNATSAGHRLSINSVDSDAVRTTEYIVANLPNYIWAKAEQYCILNIEQYCWSRQV